MNRRGFTILELALASAVATIVVASALMLFQTVDRADRRLASKFDRSTEIERTRRAFQNAFAAIATSERQRPRQNPQNDPSARGSDANPASRTGQDPAGRSKTAAPGPNPADAPAGDSVAPPPPPRLLLTPDTGPDSDPAVSALGGQRLELVLTNSPVPVLRREGAEQARMALAERAGDDQRVNPTEEGGARAIRGAFSLKPQEGPPSRDLRSDLRDTTMMELWWTPLPPAQEDPAAEPLPLSLAAGYPVKLCSDVTRCTWRLYREGQWIEQHSAVWRDELPAYAEVQIDFGTGASFKWLMEIDYTAMAEVTAGDVDADAAKADATARSGSGPASGSTRSGTTRTGGSRFRGTPVTGRPVTGGKSQ